MIALSQTEPAAQSKDSEDIEDIKDKSVQKKRVHTNDNSIAEHNFQLVRKKLQDAEDNLKTQENILLLSEKELQDAKETKDRYENLQKIIEDFKTQKTKNEEELKSDREKLKEIEQIQQRRNFWSNWRTALFSKRQYIRNTKTLSDLGLSPKESISQFVKNIRESINNKRATIIKLENEHALAQNEFQKLDTLENIKTRIEKAQTSLKKAQENLSNAKLNLEKIKKIFNHFRKLNKKKIATSIAVGASTKILLSSTVLAPLGIASSGIIVPIGLAIAGASAAGYVSSYFFDERKTTGKQRLAMAGISGLTAGVFSALTMGISDVASEFTEASSVSTGAENNVKDIINKETTDKLSENICKEKIAIEKPITERLSGKPEDLLKNVYCDETPDDIASAKTAPETTPQPLELDVESVKEDIAETPPAKEKVIPESLPEAEPEPDPNAPISLDINFYQAINELQDGIADNDKEAMEKLISYLGEDKLDNSDIAAVKAMADNSFVDLKNVVEGIEFSQGTSEGLKSLTGDEAKTLFSKLAEGIKIDDPMTWDKEWVEKTRVESAKTTLSALLK